MDTKSLELIRVTALKHVQRCRPTCPSSATCRYRHKRKNLRNGEPCMREYLQYRRFVLDVTRGQTAFDLMQATMDAALLDLLIDRCTKRLAGFRAFIEEANKAIGPGPAEQTSLRPEVNLLMRLIRRKNKLIDKCRALRPDATDASPPEQPSLAELMQTVLEVGKEDIYKAVRHNGDSPELAETWTLPGDYRRNGKRESGG